MSCSIENTGTPLCEVLPEFKHKPECIYEKDAIVVQDGSVYISLKSCNMANLSDDKSWAKLDVENFNYTAGQDSSPIGTVLTVPRDTNKFGYVDYVEGKTFNKTLFSDLFKLLGTNKFPALDSNISGDELPLGSMVHVLDDKSIPSGWVKWEVKANNLAGTDLLEVFRSIYRKSTDSGFRDLLKQALDFNTFPNVEDFFLRAGITQDSVIGSYVEDTVNFNASFKVLPLVLTEEFSANPLGCATASTNTEHSGIIQANGNTVVKVGSCDVTAGIKGTRVTHCDNAKGQTLDISAGNATETAPKHLVTHLAVKVVNKVTKAQGNFKTVIKAFDTLDTNIIEASLKISDAITEFENKAEDLKIELNHVNDNIDQIESNHDDLKNKFLNLLAKMLTGKTGEGLQGIGTEDDKLRLKVNSGDFVFDVDGTLRLATKATIQVLNLNKGVPTLGMSSFHGHISTTHNRFVIGVPRQLSLTEVSIDDALVIRDLVGQQEYDFIGYQLASNVEVVQYFINNGQTWSRSNPEGMMSDGTIRNTNAWTNWTKTTDTQIPFSVIDNHTQSISDIFRTVRLNKEDTDRLLAQLSQTIANNKNTADSNHTNTNQRITEVQNNIQQILTNEIRNLQGQVQRLTEQPCVVGIKEVRSYTVTNEDNLIISSGGVITFPNSLSVGRSWTIIQSTDAEVSVAGNIVAPNKGTLKLLGKDTAVTVIKTSATQFRMFGSTKGTV